MKKNILITGGAGFIGANFLSYMREHFPDYQIVNLDLLTYAGSLENVRAVENWKNYQFIKGDICDQILVDQIFKDHHITDVIHFAAESHVDNSITNPRAFVQTNVMGTFTLINAARSCWMEKNFKAKAGFSSSRFHHISTDEVYGSLGETGAFTEDSPYAPNSPYSASKASSDLLVRSYFHTYGLNVVTTNCSNNYGPHQHDEKLIPTIIRNALTLKPIPIYGDGKNVRDWLYVEDHCRAIELVFHSGKSGETYNIGARTEKANLDLCREICSSLDKKSPRKDGESYMKLITFVTDRPGHDRRYAIDPKKIENEMNWRPQNDLTSGMGKTIDYYLERYKPS